MILFTLGPIFCELNVLHKTTYQVHYEVILRINDVTKKIQTLQDQNLETTGSVERGDTNFHGMAEEVIT